jgi:hypothetical protein
MAAGERKSYDEQQISYGEWQGAEGRKCWVATDWGSNDMGGCLTVNGSRARRLGGCG